MQKLDGDKVIIKDPWNKNPDLLKKKFDDAMYQVKYCWRVYVPEKFKEEEELVVQGMIEIDGNESTVSMIYKDNRAYVSVRELATLLKYDVSSNGKVPVLKKKDR
jgi:cytochrome c-type biogenesis protein CcmE